MDHEIAVPPGQIADYIATRIEGLENSRTAQVGIPVYKLNGIIAHLRALDQLHRGENVDLLCPPDYQPVSHRLVRADQAEFDARASAIAECEVFTGRILIQREFSHVVKPGTEWQRLEFTPVTRIDADALAYAIDIDSAGDGWVRQSESMPGTITYEAGMAVEFDALPEPIKQAISRLEMHRSCIGADTALPDVVTALLRPYRRMRLS